MAAFLQRDVMLEASLILQDDRFTRWTLATLNLFINGALLPNTELGHLQLPGVVVEGERYAAARTRTVEQLDWPSWAARLNRYIAEMERLLWPDLVILGGAVAEHFELYRGALHTRAELRRAHFCGQAGLIGAALAAVEGQN